MPKAHRMQLDVEMHVLCVCCMDCEAFPSRNCVVVMECARRSITGFATGSWRQTKHECAAELSAGQKEKSSGEPTSSHDYFAPARTGDQSS